MGEIVKMLSLTTEPVHRLAGQIFAYQNPERVARVRLCWGEEFYAAINREKDENNEEDKTV